MLTMTFESVSRSELRGTDRGARLLQQSLSAVKEGKTERKQSENWEHAADDRRGDQPKDDPSPAFVVSRHVISEP